MIVGKPLHVLVVVGLQTDLDDILAVEREVVLDRRAAPRTERQPFAEPLVLHQLARQTVGVDRCRDGASDRQPADLAGRREIARGEGRRHRQDVGVVVEPVLVGVVGRQQRPRVNLERQQVANAVGVFRAVQTMDGRTARVGRHLGGAIEPGGE